MRDTRLGFLLLALLIAFAGCSKNPELTSNSKEAVP